MSSQHGTSTLGSLKQGTGRWRQVAGGALLAVAVVGAIGVWQVRGQSASTTPSREAAAPVAAGANGSAAAAITSGPAASILYLIDSPEEAAFIRAFEAGLNNQRTAGGAPPVHSVVLAGLTIDRAVLDQLPGAPGRQIVDLRAP